MSPPVCIQRSEETVMADSPNRAQPTVELLNRQRLVSLDIDALRRRLNRALPLCLRESADGSYALGNLDEVVVSLVSDRRIAQIHRDFMDIRGATDVITFAHGDIVISAETAQRSAFDYGHSTMEEVALYMVHGLLHLNGFLDGTECERSAMFAVQNRIWQQSRD